MIVKFGATRETDPDEILIIPEGVIRLMLHNIFMKWLFYLSL